MSCCLGAVVVDVLASYEVDEQIEIVAQDTQPGQVVGGVLPLAAVQPIAVLNRVNDLPVHLSSVTCICLIV